MDKDALADLRKNMVAEIEAEALLTATYTERPVFAPAVIDVVGRVPRHEFVPVVAVVLPTAMTSGNPAGTIFLTSAVGLLPAATTTTRPTFFSAATASCIG